MRAREIILIVLMASSIVSARETIAVMQVNGNAYSDAQREALTNRIISSVIGSGAYDVLERSRTIDILKEQGFQQSGSTTSENAVEAGKLLNVKYILFGEVAKAGVLTTLDLRMVSVTTGKIINTVSENYKFCSFEKLLKEIESAAFKVTQNPPEETGKEVFINDSVFLTMKPVPMGKKTVYFDAFEVTQEQYRLQFPNYEMRDNCPKCPARNVSWKNAGKYCASFGKRLPTEIEWETAARGPDNTFWARFSKKEKLEYSWLKNNAQGKVHAVGSKKPGPYLLYDMVGNVQEWCQNTVSNSSLLHSVTGFGGSDECIAKGFGFEDDPSEGTISDRTTHALDFETEDIGFRCVKEK